MEKPKLPQKPDPKDLKKYPYAKTKEGRNYLNEPVFLPNADFIRDCEKYRKDMIQYEKDMILFEQMKYIKLIRNASDKYILKTFNITKK